MQENEKMRPGDIVSFAFPFREGIAPYARPSLVLETTEDEVLLAYGTTSEERANVGHEVRVATEFLVCGLARPSRFVLTRRIRVSIVDTRFARNTAGTIRLGCLTSDLMTRKRNLMGLISRSWVSEAERQKAEREGIHPKKYRHRGRRAKARQNL